MAAIVVTAAALLLFGGLIFRALGTHRDIETSLRIPFLGSFSLHARNKRANERRRRRPHASRSDRR
jgi:hypothetical protein